VSERNKLGIFTERLAAALAGFSVVDVGIDFYRADFTFATVKSVCLLLTAILLFLSVRKPGFFSRES